MTNGDKIRQMTDEELAHFMECIFTRDLNVERLAVSQLRTAHQWRNWLKQEKKS